MRKGFARGRGNKKEERREERSPTMHTVSSRANAILYYGAMVLLVALMANVATSYFCFSYDVPNVDLKLNRVEKLYV